DISLDRRGFPAGIQTLIELCGIELEIDSALFKIRYAELPLIPKHGIVELPEVLLFESAQRSFRRLLGMRMDIRQWKLTIHNPDFIRVVRLHLSQRREQPAAIRTLEIGKLDDGHRCRCRTL